MYNNIYLSKIELVQYYVLQYVSLILNKICYFNYITQGYKILENSVWYENY